MDTSRLVEDVARAKRVSHANRHRLRMFTARPDPPRGIQWNGTTARWFPPAEDRNFTHYRIYHQDEDTLFAEVSAGVTNIDGLTAAGWGVYISTYSYESGLESQKTAAVKEPYPA